MLTKLPGNKPQRVVGPLNGTIFCTNADCDHNDTTHICNEVKQFQSDELDRLVNGRDLYECANQLGGYVGPTTPKDLKAFLMRESDAACDLANEVIRLRNKVNDLKKSLKDVGTAIIELSDHLK